MLGLEATEQEYFRRRTFKLLSPRKSRNELEKIAAERRKLKRKHLKNIRSRVNKYIVKNACAAGVIFVCHTPDDECPTKTGVCAKWHEPNEFMKHWICSGECGGRAGKYDNNIQIVRHMRTRAHIEWYKSIMEQR